MSDSSKALSKLVIPSPVGPMQAFASDRGVRAIVFSDSDPARNGVSGNITTGKSVPDTHRIMLDAVRVQLTEYFAGSRKTFDLPLDPLGTEFQQQAWRALSEIPFGQTRSYAEQARAIGRPSAVRAIGAANGRNPLTIVVPCHRVIGTNGMLTGFAGGLHRKRALLEHEGVLRPDAELPFAT
jgi:methylated-DNA-[protein]-cysteine S-methyltransferase